MIRPPATLTFGVTSSALHLLCSAFASLCADCYSLLELSRAGPLFLVIQLIFVSTLSTIIAIYVMSGTFTSHVVVLTMWACNLSTIFVVARAGIPICLRDRASNDFWFGRKLDRRVHCLIECKLLALFKLLAPSQNAL